MTEKEKIQNVDKIIEEEYKHVQNTRGLCHRIWTRKKQSLKEMYDIDWLTPAEKRPETIFD